MKLYNRFISFPLKLRMKYYRILIYYISLSPLSAWIYNLCTYIVDTQFVQHYSINKNH